MAKQITEEEIDLLIERLVSRVNKANEVFLLNIGKYIKEIKNLSPSKAYQLVQILKYGGNFDEIMEKIMQYSGMNIQDVDAIFSNYAKRDQYFYEKFYRYRNIPFIPFEQNTALKLQTMALANIVKVEMYDYFRENVLGYSIKDAKDNIVFKGMKDVYNEMLDTALLNVSQGKETFDSSMRKILNEVGTSGLKTVDYKSGRSVRLDSALRMHLNSRLTELHNENQKIFGEEFGANGVEVTHHINAAPDHINTVDGKQFALIDKIQEQINNGIETKIKQDDIRGNQVKVDGKWYDDFNAINNALQRPVSELNCKHKIFSIILGVSEPEYTQKELDEDKKENIDGFNFEGKHYSNYEGTQLQRQLEREVRKQKDTQILAKASDNKELIATSQDNITKLTQKYKELSKISGLPTYMNRMRVSGFKRVAKSKLK